MAKTEEGGQNKVELEYPTELLKKMVCQRSLPATEDELSLDLSSNGRFGVDPRGSKLARSSSTPVFNGGFSPATSLVRARSLPAEEWRKRKAMQCMGMVEAKPKPWEKEWTPKGVSDQGGDNGGARRSPASLNGFSGIGIWSLDRKAAGGGFDWKWSRSEKAPRLPRPREALNGPRGRELAGNNLPGEARRHEVIHPPPGFYRQQPAQPEEAVEIAGVGRVSQSMEKELMRKAFVNMPCVSTMGDGPNGEKVEGFLYEYRTVEELSIVCLCHGLFFSPAEFVKHAGGGDVENPMKLIIVSPTFQ